MEYEKDPLKIALQRFANQSTGLVVQVGANDARDDILHLFLSEKTGWTALLIEPVPYLMSRLKARYGSDRRFRYENVAIADKESSMPFYYLSPLAGDCITDLPSWYEQLGSFDKNHIPKHFDNRLNEKIKRHICCEYIPTMTLDNILRKNDVRGMDLLQIDTEGSDWMVLNSLNLHLYQPSMILYEHKHLDLHQQAFARTLLDPLYRLEKYHMDFLCTRRN